MSGDRVVAEHSHWRGQHIRAADLADTNLAATSVAELISDASLRVVHPEDLVGTAADLMARNDIGRMSVTDSTNNRLVGLVSRKDLLQARTQMRRLEQERDILLLRSKPSMPVPSELGR